MIWHNHCLISCINKEQKGQIRTFTPGASMSSSVLLSPLTIRKTTLRNRIMLPSMVTHYCAVNGEVSERLIAYHAERAYGGVGLNMLESTSVDDTGKSYWPGVSIASDHFIKGLRRLTDAIHAHGGKAGIQLNHAGRLAQPAVSGHPRQLVSYIPGLTTYDDIHVMDEDDIERVIGSFCSAAERAAEAGFDVIEIHGAHGYLLSQFMSPLFNRREDAYGGNFEKRMRVPVEVIRGIRKRLGPDFPLFFRCSVEEYLPGGITLELARDIARTVADNGIDLFNVSVGLGETNRFTGPPPCLPKGWNADRAAAIKEALGDRALVGVAGRIIDRERNCPSASIAGPRAPCTTWSAPCCWPNTGTPTTTSRNGAAHTPPFPPTTAWVCSRTAP